MGKDPFPSTESHADRLSQAYRDRLLIGPGSRPCLAGSCAYSCCRIDPGESQGPTTVAIGSHQDPMATVVVIRSRPHHRTAQNQSLVRIDVLYEHQRGERIAHAVSNCMPCIEKGISWLRWTIKCSFTPCQIIESKRGTRNQGEGNITNITACVSPQALTIN
jgi:hypothetical protein